MPGQHEVEDDEIGGEPAQVRQHVAADVSRSMRCPAFSR